MRKAHRSHGGFFFWYLYSFDKNIFMSSLKFRKQFCYGGDCCPLTCNRNRKKKGKVLTMSKNMLGVALRDFCGPLNTLVERLAGEDGEMWLKELNKLLRGEACWPNGISYSPLEWGRDLLFVDAIKDHELHIKLNQNQPGSPWRIPTRDELDRKLKSLTYMEFQRVNKEYYLTLLVANGRVLPEIVFHDGKGNLFHPKDDQKTKTYSVWLCLDIVK